MSISQSHPASPVHGPVLLIGTGGMLARAWVALLKRRGIELVEPGLDELDLTKPDTLARWVDGRQPRFPLVLNCAAWTDVDGAEKNEAVATAINGTGVGDLARRCAAAGATLVHYSTDYVFSGQATTPYRPDQPREPLNAYGRSKAVGEQLIETSGCRYLLLRTSWLYAPWGRNFARTIARLSGEKPSLRVVADQRGRPTSAEHLAAATLALLEKGATGTYHATDGGECTWYDFAAAIARQLNPACRVEPCATDQYPTPAQRPAYSVLDVSATEALLGPLPTWQANLADVLGRLEPFPAPGQTAAATALGGKQER